MATPQVSDNPEVQANYLSQLALGAAVTQQVSGLWTATTPTASVEAMARFTEGLFILAEGYGDVAASMGADYYREVRLEAGITSTPSLPTPLPVPRSEIDAAVAWATREREALADDLEAMHAAILADMQAEAEKAVLDVQRQYLIDAVTGDEEAIGFRRVPRPDACYWCISLAIRSSTRRGIATDWASGARDPKFSAPGADGELHYGVYKSRKAAGQLPSGAAELNRFHTNCHCAVEPVFSPATTLPDWLGELKTLYSDSTEESAKGEHLNDFRKALRAHRNGEQSPPPAAPVALPTATPATGQIEAILDRLNEAMAA